MQNNDKDTNFKVGDHVRMLKPHNIFAKVYVPNCSEEDFMVKKLYKKLWHGHVLLMTLTVKKLWEQYTKNSRKRQIKQTLGQKIYLKEQVINYMSN